MAPLKTSSTNDVGVKTPTELHHAMKVATRDLYRLVNETPVAQAAPPAAPPNALSNAPPNAPPVPKPENVARHPSIGGKRLPGHPSTGGKRLPGHPSTGGKRLPERLPSSSMRIPGTAFTEQKNKQEHPSTGGIKLPGYGFISGKNLPEYIETGGTGSSELVPDTDWELDGDDDAVENEIDEDDDASLEAALADHTSFLDLTTIVETPGDGCTSIDEQVLSSLKAKAKRAAPRKTHSPMKAAQQRESIEQLKGQLALFPPFGKEEDSTIASPASPAQIAPPAMPISPVSPKGHSKPGPNPPTKKRTRVKSAQVDSPLSPETVEPTRPKKPRITTEARRRSKVFKKISPEAQKVMSDLQNMSQGVETSLGAVVTNAKAVLLTPRPDDNTAVVGDLEEKVGAWKQSNREHLGGVVGLLERNGVLAMGAVEVPTGDLREENGGDASGGFGEIFGGAGGLFDGVEMGEDGKAWFGGG